MLKRTGASVGWQIAGLLTFALCLDAFAGTGGLLGISYHGAYDQASIKQYVVGIETHKGP